jgi:hypothetical protein
MAKDVDISGSLRIEPDSHIKIDPGSQIEVQGTEAHPFYIQKLQNIAPIAAHIKEINHIDPISVEALEVSQVRNVEPLKIERFNVTNLPTVNLSLRQIPSVDLNIRRLPALSVGTHQVFDMPSNYVVRARVLGIELLRIHLAGRTRIGPRELFRREQERVGSRSFPVAATAGNPAIPSIHLTRESRASRAAGISFGSSDAGFRISGPGAGVGTSSVSSGG